MIGLVGKKCGMTQIFSEEGALIPVSVISIEPNRITQVKTKETDGYDGIQVTTGQIRANLVDKARAGQFAKAGVEAGRHLFEYRLGDGEAANYKAGDDIPFDTFKEGQAVDIQGVSKGKGFAGAIKRHNFGMQGRSNNSLSHRAVGSIGQCQTPGRVYKGRKMPGHLGAERVTVQNQQIVKVDAERNVILVRGGIPGAKGGWVTIKPALKAGPVENAEGDKE